MVQLWQKKANNSNNKDKFTLHKRKKSGKGGYGDIPEAKRAKIEESAEENEDA